MLTRDAAFLMMSLVPLTLMGQPPMQDSYADLPGVRIHYQDSGGAGQPVVLLHAATGNTNMWQFQVPALTKAGYRVITYDRRNWGRTVVQQNAAVGTAPDDLAGLLDHLKLDRVHLVGTAAGGIVALDFAVSYPNRLRSLVITNSIGSLQDPDFQALINRLRPPGFNDLPADFRELGPAFRASNPEGVKRWLDFEHSSRIPNSTPQPTKNRMTMAMLRQFKMPAMILAGGADLFAPGPVMRRIADAIPNSEFVVAPDAGHSTFWEQPDFFNQSLIAFLRKH